MSSSTGKNARFWFEKLFLLVAVFVLLGAGWWLWDYSEEEPVVTEAQTAGASTQPVAQQPAAATPQSQNTPAPADPVEEVFPFSFDGKKTAADFPDITDDFLEFSYDFATNSSVQVDRDGFDNEASLSRDFIWEYTLVDGQLSLTTTPITFCSNADNCGIGNGVMEVIVRPAVDAGTDAVFYITDSGEVTEFTAVDKYTPLLETYQEIGE